MKPTEEEIVAEIAALKTVQPTVPKFSALWPDSDQHAAIEAQIKTLETRKSELEIFADLANEADNVLDAARAAVLWMVSESEEGAPSESWKSQGANHA